MTVTTDVSAASATLPLDSAQVRDAILWAAAAASTDRYVVPVLQSLRITIGDAADYGHWTPGDPWRVEPVAGPSLTVAATDRYRLHWASVPLDGIEESSWSGTVELSVHAADVVRAVKAWRRSEPFVIVTADASRLTLATSSGTATFDHVDGDYPQVASLLKLGGDAPERWAAFTPAYLAAGADVVKREKGAVIALRTRGDKPASLAVVSPSNPVRRSGLLMPYRIPA